MITLPNEPKVVMPGFMSWFALSAVAVGFGGVVLLLLLAWRFL